jgi:hypothetical protein
MPPLTYWVGTASSASSARDAEEVADVATRDVGEESPGRGWRTSSRQPRQWSMPPHTPSARQAGIDGAGEAAPVHPWRSSSRQQRQLSLPPDSYWSGRVGSGPVEDADDDRVADDESTAAPFVTEADEHGTDEAATPEAADVDQAAMQAGSDHRDRSLSFFDPPFFDARPSHEPDQTAATSSPTPAVAAVHRPTLLSPSRRNRRSGLIVAAVIVALVSASGVAVWAVNRDPAAPGSTAPTTPPTDRGVRQPRPPVALAADATYTQVRVLPTGELAVRQWIRSSSPISDLHLAEPVGDLLPAGTVQASDLRIVAGAQAAGAVTEVGTSPVAVSFPPTTEVFVSYVLSGMLERSDSEEGRALARVTQLDLSYQPEATRTTIAFLGPEVLSLACSPLFGNVAPSACGAKQGGKWLVELPGAQSTYRVMAQLDLGTG